MFSYLIEFGDTFIDKLSPKIFATNFIDNLKDLM